MSASDVRAAVEAVFAAQGIALDPASLTQSLEQLGFDSLHAVELQLALEQALGLSLGEGDAVEKSFHTLPLAKVLAHVVDRAQSRDK